MHLCRIKKISILQFDINIIFAVYTMGSLYVPYPVEI